MDTFTTAHLASWCADNAWPDDQDEFYLWATKEVTEDPTMADYGWAALYRGFHRS